MGNFGETVGKKERDKKKMKKRQDKQEKMEERKAKATKGKTLEEMMAYIDENGNLSSKPPDPRNLKRVVRAEDMQISTPKAGKFDPADLIRTGIVTFFNEAKGFGFIKDLQTQESVFVHVNQLSERISENQKVIFETENGPRGLNAVNVKKAVQ
ncbi:MAG TPA: cold shock domain-containing protein [Puia sp.]|nr:cold shock domain-containing protein [Puia sp.]